VEEGDWGFGGVYAAWNAVRCVWMMVEVGHALEPLECCRAERLLAGSVEEA